MRRKPLLMQLLMGMSMRRYLPPMGTAGSLRFFVSGYRRVPRPPPRITLRTFSIGRATFMGARATGATIARDVIDGIATALACPQRNRQAVRLASFTAGRYP